MGRRRRAPKYEGPSTTWLVLAIVVLLVLEVAWIVLFTFIAAWLNQDRPYQPEPGTTFLG